MEVICFGDSNTYGYDPQGYFGGRYDADSRWMSILAEGKDGLPRSSDQILSFIIKSSILPCGVPPDIV